MGVLAIALSIMIKVVPTGVEVAFPKKIQK
jgi:hypothetical protein